MKTFHIIHPSIVNLYINSLTLHILQEKLDSIGPEGLTQDFQDEFDEAASEYMISVRNAENIFRSPAVVQNQLNIFTQQRQGDA